MHGRSCRVHHYIRRARPPRARRAERVCRSSSSGARGKRARAGGVPVGCFRHGRPEKCYIRRVSRFARKVRRSRRSKVTELDAEALMNELTRSSLRLDDAQWAEVHASDSNELADVALARWLELNDLLGVYSDGLATLRAQLDERRGVEFFARVAAMGEPARAALERAGLAPVNEPLDRIRYRSEKWLPRRPRAYYRTRRGENGRGKCIRSKGRSVGSTRRFAFTWASATGPARVRASSRGRGSRSRSCSSGGVDVSASVTSRTGIRTSLSSEPTGRSSARRGRTERASREAWCFASIEAPDA